MVVIPNTVQIIKSLVSSIASSVVIGSIVDNGDNTFTITTCNTYYLTVQMEVTISGTVYKVVEVNVNQDFTIKKKLESDPSPSGSSFTLPSPFFINGTIISAGRELDKIEDWRVKYPMVFLYEMFEDTGFVDETTATGYESRVRLFFMNQTDPQNYTNIEQHELVVDPMRALCQEFLNVVEANSRIINKLTNDFRLKNWVNFGRFETEKGNMKKYFSDDLSGCELTITLPIKRSYLESLYCNC